MFVTTEVATIKSNSLLCSCRLTLALIGFLMFFHLYAQRIGMSVAIVCMVNQTAIRDIANSSMQFTNKSFDEVEEQCVARLDKNGSTTLKVGYSLKSSI